MMQPRLERGSGGRALDVQPPFGFWGPLGGSVDGGAKAFRRRRETELKHGRVSMIARISYVTPECFKFSR